MTVDTPVLLCGDNQGALALASNPNGHKRAKRIETRHHFIRQMVEDKRFHLSYVSTKNNLTLSSLTTQLFYITYFYLSLQFMLSLGL